mgnify:FL=1
MTQQAMLALLAGAAYCEPLVPELWRRGWITVEKPLARLGIGRQRKRLAEMIAAAEAEAAS